MHEDDDEHAGFDAAQLREHEEFTKVKNVAKIELGRYEMETWYFSPLPDEFKGCTVSTGAAIASTALIGSGRCQSCKARVPVKSGHRRQPAPALCS